MKIYLIAVLTFLSSVAFAQQIEIPKGVVYKYCDSATLAKAKALVTTELTGTPTYELNNGIAFIGPGIWKRYSQIPALSSIKGGDVTIRGYKQEYSKAKMTQDKQGFKLVWDQLRNELVGHDMVLRKATPSELVYYWAVISFDIEEPLIIVETKDHNYIINLSPKELKLVWLDEVPRS